MAQQTAAQRSASAKKAAATRKKNAAVAAKKGSKAPSKSTFWTSVKTTGQKFLTWLGKNWFLLLVLIVLIWAVLTFAAPWLSILKQRNNAAIANAQGAPAVSAPASAAPVTTGSIVVSESTVLDLGSIGAFHAVYDAKIGKYTLGIWDESATRLGSGLDNFKKAASSVTFTMPADGTINNSAGHIAVDSVEWTLGNPATDKDGNSLIKKGQSVTIFTDGPNPSAGFQIWFN